MKKVLAWAVVLALVLSSFTMAFADQTKTSADFKDASQIQYTEAVDVMVALGVINGFPDGTFGPQKTVTRGQMAKMIACILNGGEDVGDQYKSACPFADSKDHWAAGYIAYCAGEHIIDGRSADVFDPDADVTGTEVAKMALTSLGYDSKIQGYTGETWAAAVLKDAKKNNLFKGLDKSFVPGDPCPREAAAQILFNMLKAPMVEYDTNTSVSVNDATIAVSSKAEKVVAEDEVNADGTAKEGETGYVELYEEVFGGDLVLDPAKGDDFGNPGHSWTYDKDDVGTYVDSPAYEFTAEDMGFEAALEAFDKDLSKSYQKDKLVIASFTVNGDKEIGEPGSFMNSLPGLGDKVKMYEATVDEPVDGVAYYDVVVEMYYAAQITKVDTDVDEDAAEEGITALLTLKSNGRESTPIPDTDFVGFDASTFVEGAVVALAPNFGAESEDAPTYIDSYVMDELASGAIDEINMTDYTATIAGTEYNFAKPKYNPIDVTPEVGGEYTLYDYNGYALTSVETAKPETAIAYGVLEAKGQDKDRYGNVTDFVKVFTTDAKEAEYNIAKDCKGTVPASVDGNGLDDALIAYTLNDDEEIDAIDNFTEITTGTISNATLKTNNVVKVDNKNVKVSEDVVVFWNKAEYTAADPEAEPPVEEAQGSEYEILGLSDLANADTISGACFIKDNEVVAIKLTAPLEKAEEPEKILGFVTSVKNIQDTEGAKQKVDAILADGTEAHYTTVKGYTSVSPAADLVEFEVTDKGLEKVTSVEAKIVESTTGELVTEFAEGTLGVFRAGEVYEVDATAGNLNLGSESTGPDYQPVGTVVLLKKGSVVEASKLSDVKVGSNVKLYQINADATAWDIVVWAAPTI